jgi:hypothetical protein
MAKVMCAHCKAIVNNKPFCSECRKPLVIDADGQSVLKEALDDYGFLHRAKAMQNIFKLEILARIQVLKLPDDGSIPKIKPINVPSGHEVFMYSSHHPEALRKGPGVYEPAELFEEHGLSSTLQADDAYSWCCFCYVRRHAVTTTFALPDMYLFNQSGAVELTGGEIQSAQQALRNLSLVDADGLFGGGTVQIELQCHNPAQLMRTAVQEFLERKDVKPRLEQANVPRIVAPPPEPKSFLNRMWTGMKRLVGIRPPDVPPTAKAYFLEPTTYDLWDLYEYIRAELQDTIKQTVRDLNASQLFDNKSNARGRVEEAIQAELNRTLEQYGIAINRVTAFEFICPAFLDVRKDAGDVTIAEKRAELLKRTAELNKKAAELASQERIADIELEAKESIAKIEKQAEVDQVADKAKAESVERELSLEAKKQDHTRTQKAADTRLDHQLDFEKHQQTLALETDRTRTMMELEFDRKERELKLLGQAMELKEKYAALEHDRQLKAELDRVRAYTGLPPELASALLAAHNPQMIVGYVAQQQALSGEQKLEVYQRCQHQLESAYGKTSEQVMSFATEVAKQTGHVLGKYLGGPDAPQLPGRTVPNAAGEENPA